MEIQNWFKDWFNSPYYHKLYANRDEKEAADFISKLISFLHPSQGATMLDVGCGKGRHAFQLSEYGYDVTGIDLSEESIDYALQNQSDKLHFYRHDMRFPFWINYFDFTFNFFTSFGYFKNDREHNNAIRTMAQSLKKNGILTIDYLNVAYSEKNFIADYTSEIDNIEYCITKWFDDSFFYKKIVINDPALTEPVTFAEKVAKFNLADFEGMLTKQNLTIQQVFGDYNLQEFNVNNSPRLIIIAKKN